MKTDKSIVGRIIDYCEETRATVERFGEDFETFKNDLVYKNATALCVLQIGELTTHLSEDFKNVYAEIQWVQIKALRNIVAHSYGKIDAETLWETVTTDIPALEAYCVEILENWDLR
jgi:uncharacterized protein with HEPN domain